jgi:hypothetical protein
MANFSMTAAVKIGTRAAGTYALYTVNAQTTKSSAPQRLMKIASRTSQNGCLSASQSPRQLTIANHRGQSLGTISPAKIGYRAEHCFSMVLIEVMVKATEAAPVLVEELELVLSDGDSFPVTSTCCPR